MEERERGRDGGGGERVKGRNGGNSGKEEQNRWRRGRGENMVKVEEREKVYDGKEEMVEVGKKWWKRRGREEMERVLHEKR